MAYQWYLGIADLNGAANCTARSLWVMNPQVDASNDSWWDAMIRLKNAGLVRFSTDGQPCWERCLPDYSIKKLGMFSWKYPTSGQECGPDLAGFRTPIIAGDTVEMYAWLDNGDARKQYIAACWLLEWDGHFNADFVFDLPPLPAPTIQPMWKKQIGEE